MPPGFTKGHGSINRGTGWHAVEACRFLVMDIHRATNAYRARLLLMANWANHVALSALERFPVSPELFAQSPAVIAGAGRGWAGFRLPAGQSTAV